ncbi:MAG: NUDIX hydrolase [Planctomycetes bacterium]|nr:NUDIX hydrolase [Planctomycetota bacterium]
MTAPGKPFVYDYPQMGTTADIVCFAAAKGKLKTVLVRRLNEPFRDSWVLPGGYVEIDELFENAAFRELAEETGLHARSLHPVGFFDGIGRDPRRRVVTMAYYAVFTCESPLSPGDDAADARWAACSAPLDLGFDHRHILAGAVRALRRDSFLCGRYLDLLPPDGQDPVTALAAVLDSEEKACLAMQKLGPDGGRHLVEPDFPSRLAPLADLFLA